MSLKNKLLHHWLGLGIKHDGDEYIQSKNIDKHISVADELIKKRFCL